MDSDDRTMCSFTSLFISDSAESRAWDSSIIQYASGCVVECRCHRICNREVAGSNLGLGYFASRSTQPSIPLGSVNEYQLRLGRQRQVWLIPIANECVGVQVKLWNLLRTHAIPECFCGGDSLQRGAISSVCTLPLRSNALIIVFVIIIIHVILSFSSKTFSFLCFLRNLFFIFYIVFVLKTNIVFVSVSDGQSIYVSVIVTVTEISLHVGGLLAVCCYLRQRRLCFHWHLFVCYQDYADTHQLIFTEFVGKVAHGAWRKQI